MKPDDILLEFFKGYDLQKLLRKRQAVIAALLTEKG